MNESVTSPRRNINSVTLEELAQKNTAIFLPVLIDVKHPEIVWKNQTGLEHPFQDGHLRLVNDTRGINYKGDDEIAYYYAPCTFNLKLPKEDGKKVSNATITISCVDSRIIEVIRSVEEDLTCRIVALFAKKTNDEGRTVYVFSKQYGKEFTMGSVTWDGVTATWELEPDPVMNLNVPRDMASAFRTPGASED